MNSTRVSLGRSDVSRLLQIPEWQIASFASRRYAYRIRPTARSAKGRGSKALYGLAYIYKIALAHRMLSLGMEARITGEALREIFPKGSDPIEICVRERPTRFKDARYLVINFALAPWVDQRKLPIEWGGENPHAQSWADLWRREDVSKAWDTTLVLLRTAFIMPFDELLAEVDSRLLGRKVEFSIDAPTIPNVGDGD